MERFDRLQPILDCIVSSVLSQPAAIVGIEHYALSKSPFQSSSQSCMIELGAVIRHQLFQRVPIVVELAPTQVKRMFSGQGCATKKEMYQAYLTLYQLPSLMTMVGLTREYTDMPKPPEDMVDSLAVAFTAMMLQQ